MGMTTSLAGGADGVTHTDMEPPSLTGFPTTDSVTAGVAVEPAPSRSRMVTLTEGCAPAVTDDGRDAARDTVKVSSSVSASRVVAMTPEADLWPAGMVMDASVP